jgi:hypothetical protein
VRRVIVSGVVRRGISRWFCALAVVLALGLAGWASLAGGATINPGPAVRQLQLISSGNSELWGQLNGSVDGLSSGGAVQQFDPQTGQPLGPKTDLSPNLALAFPKMAIGSGDVWITEITEGANEPNPSGRSALYEISERTRLEVDAPIGLARLGKVSAMVVASGSVWILGAGANGRGDLLRVDIARREQTAEIQLPAGALVPGIVYSAGALWTVLTQAGHSTLVRVDATSGAARTRALSLPGPPLALAAGDGSMWLESGAGTGGEPVLAQLDPSSGRVIVSVSLAASPPHGESFNTGAIAVAPRTVWAAATTAASLATVAGTLIGVDPATRTIVAAPQPLPSSVASQPVLTLAIADHSLWLPGTNRLYQVAEDSGAPAQPRPPAGYRGRPRPG